MRRRGPGGPLQELAQAEQHYNGRHHLAPDHGHEGGVQPTAVTHQQDAEQDPDADPGDEPGGEEAQPALSGRTPLGTRSPRPVMRRRPVARRW